MLQIYHFFLQQPRKHPNKSKLLPNQPKAMSREAKTLSPQPSAEIAPILTCFYLVHPHYRWHVLVLSNHTLLVFPTKIGNNDERGSDKNEGEAFCASPVRLE